MLTDGETVWFTDDELVYLTRFEFFSMDTLGRFCFWGPMWLPPWVS